MLRALVASALLNVILLVVAGVLGTVAWKAAGEAELKAENASLKATAALTGKVAEAASTQNLEVQTQLADLVERGRTTRIEYRDRLGKLPPLPLDCIPGRARQDAVNDLIRNPAGAQP